MKTSIHLGILIVTSLLLIQGCGISRSAAEKEQIAADIENAVIESEFTFNATYAFPTGFKSRYLSPYYEVDVSPDTIKVYLPYFGRAYKAPINPSDGGYMFTSTDFNYRYEKGKRSGNWLVDIKFNDLDRAVTLNFDIWENETARLTVTDIDRQPISFQGDIVVNNKEDIEND